MDTLRISGPMTLLVLKAHEMYRAGKPIEEVAAKYGISRNFVSQIKTRIDRRIVMVGKELIAGLGRV